MYINKILSVLYVMSLMVMSCFGDTLNLIDKDSVKAGWRFDNGREFGGGASGSLEAVADASVPTLRLTGDFSKAGLYVQMMKSVNKDVSNLMFDVKVSDGALHQTIRLIDGSGQCHQINIGLNGSKDWQTIVFPIDDFFDKKGTSSAVTLVKRYENWGGSKDGKWHNPLKSIVFLCNKQKDGEAKRAIEFRNIRVHLAKQAESEVYADNTIKLDEILRFGEIDWSLYLGDAAGTKGDLALIEKKPGENDYGIRISADFSETKKNKPRYVSAQYSTEFSSSVKFKQLSFWFRSEQVKLISLRVTDGTGQTHQVRKKVEADGEWHRYTMGIDDIVGRESWGGAKDRKWHDTIKHLAFIIGYNDSLPPKLSMDISGVALDVEMLSSKVETIYHEKFENGLNGWEIIGNASLKQKDAFEGKNALVVSRTSIDSERAEVLGPKFYTKAKKLKVSGASSSVLEGLDNSFMGRIGLQWFDSKGKRVSSTILFEQWRRQNWQRFSKELDVPAGAVQARFFIQILKATGEYSVDDLKVETVPSVNMMEERISKVKISNGCIGNMPYPGDDVIFTITSVCKKPLPASWRNFSWTITDYWGNEVFSSEKTVMLTRQPKKKKSKTFNYQAEIDITDLPLETGKYYEMHIRIPRDGGDDYTDYKSFAILPEPETFKYPAKDIPFTTRSWDNRIPDYLKLSHRIGHRVAGIWGRFKKTPPYKSMLSNSKLANELGMGVLSTSEINIIEKHRSGWEKMTTDIMVEGTKSIINDPEMKDLIYMSLGNEPPTTLERAKECLPYYKAVYEIIKKERPEIQVIGTAVGPSEPYFQAGFGAYQDMYDFHTYEDYRKIPSIFAKYKAMFKKYGHEKPICSTEIGLNSQGQPRYDVALTLIKKFSIFFECGGAHVSWFGIMYPDPTGKAFGGSGDAHNTFDCRYNVYAPRLDAIAYYYMMNGILVKDFIEKKQYGDTEAYLFADEEGNCFVVIWNDNQTEMVSFAPEGVSDFELLRIDGSSVKLKSSRSGVTLKTSDEPVMLKYKQQSPALPEKLGTYAFTVKDVPASLAKGSSLELKIQGKGIRVDDFVVKAPVGWQADLSQKGDDVVLNLSVSKDAMGRIGRIYVQHMAGGDINGEAVISIPLAPPLEILVTALAKEKDKEPLLKVTLKNNSAKEHEAYWSIKLLGQLNMENGSYKLGQLTMSDAYFAGDSSGMKTIPAGKSEEILIPLSKFDEKLIYKIEAKVADATGRSSLVERYIGGLAGAKKTDVAPKIDGILNEECWQKAQPVYINEARQLYQFNHEKNENDRWSGVDDLSAEIRYAWDDDYLYIAINGKDDVFANPGQDSSLWRMDGVQMLVDPCRDKTVKSGKYDYVFGCGQKGPQAWCSLSAISRVPAGLVDSIKVGFNEKITKQGKFAYEIAIPWDRVQPFTPSVGGNLGLAIILNEDDGFSRQSFMGWFSGVHSKQLDLVGDVILEK